MTYAERLFCTILCCCGLLWSARAQTRVPRRFEFGATGGAVLSRYTFDPKITQDMARGYTVGVAGRYVEERIFGLQAEVLVTRRGFHDRYDAYPDYDYQRDLTYLEIPVMAHLYFEMGKHSEITFDAGPKFGAFLWDKSTSNLPDDFGSSSSTTRNYHTEHHTMSVHNNFDYGIQAGLGYEFKCSRHVSVQVSGRYYFGLGNMFPDDKSDTFENSSNQHVQIVMAVWWKHWIRRRPSQ